MAKRQNRRWSLEEKRGIVQRMESCRHQDLADEIGVDRRQLYAWRMQLRREAEGPIGEGREQQLEREVRQLREALGRKGDGSGFLAGKQRGEPLHSPRSWRLLTRRSPLAAG